MSFKAKLLIDDAILNLLKFTYKFRQGTDATGRPSQKPIFDGLEVTVEMQKGANFYDWMLANNLDKEIKIELPSKFLGGRTRTLSLSNAHLVHLVTNYSADDDLPASITLFIKAAGVEDSFSSGIYSASWRTTFNEPEVAATVIPSYEPTLLGHFFEDEQGEAIAQTDIEPNQKIVLVVEAENADGESIMINLHDDRLDFKHRNTVLKNDTLTGVSITGEQTRIPLTTICEQE